MPTETYIQTRCPNPQCRREYRVKAELVGKTASCKGCGKEFILSVAARSTLIPSVGDGPAIQRPEADPEADGIRSGAKPSVRTALVPTAETPQDSRARVILPWLGGTFGLLTVLGLLGYVYVLRGGQQRTRDTLMSQVSELEQTNRQLQQGKDATVAQVSELQEAKNALEAESRRSREQLTKLRKELATSKAARATVTQKPKHEGKSRDQPPKDQSASSQKKQPTPPRKPDYVIGPDDRGPLVASKISTGELTGIMINEGETLLFETQDKLDHWYNWTKSLNLFSKKPTVGVLYVYKGKRFIPSQSDPTEEEKNAKNTPGVGDKRTKVVTAPQTPKKRLTVEWKDGVPVARYTPKLQGKQDVTEMAVFLLLTKPDGPNVDGLLSTDVLEGSFFVEAQPTLPYADMVATVSGAKGGTKGFLFVLLPKSAGGKNIDIGKPIEVALATFPSAHALPWDWLGPRPKLSAGVGSFKPAATGLELSGTSFISQIDVIEFDSKRK
jgi:cell division protein FtsB